LFIIMYSTFSDHSHALYTGRRGDRSRATAPSTSATAMGPAPRHGEKDERWKKVERKRKEKGKERKGVSVLG